MQRKGVEKLILQGSERNGVNWCLSFVIMKTSIMTPTLDGPTSIIHLIKCRFCHSFNLLLFSFLFYFILYIYIYMYYFYAMPKGMSKERKSGTRRIRKNSFKRSLQKYISHLIVN
jgi:hypothetical protein